MATNKKPKKKHDRTKYVGTGKGNVLFRHPQKDEDQLQIWPHLSLQQFIDGVGTVGSFETLEFRIHAGLKLLDLFEESAAINELIESTEILTKVKRDRKLTAKWTFAPDQLSQLRISLNIIDTVQVNCTRKQMLDTYKATAAMIASPSFIVH
jgi:hypothetical protein